MLINLFYIVDSKGDIQEIFIHVHANRRVLNQILQNKNFVVRRWVM